MTYDIEMLLHRKFGQDLLVFHCLPHQVEVSCLNLLGRFGKPNVNGPGRQGEKKRSINQLRASLAVLLILANWSSITGKLNEDVSQSNGFNRLSRLLLYSDTYHFE